MDKRIGMARPVRIVLFAGFVAGAVGIAAGAGFTVRPGENVLAVRDKIRAARASGEIKADEPVKVTFAPGDYRFASTLLLERQDSGSAGNPVVWRAEKPGTVRILGGSVIPREAFHPISAAARTRILPEAADRVLEADVGPLLAKDPKPWPDGPPEGLMPGPWLYVGGKSQQLARWPNADAPNGGWASYTNVLESRGWKIDETTGKPAVIEFPGNRAERWKFDEGVWFMGYFIVDWDCDLQRIASYDRATHGARLAGPSHWGVDVGGWPFFSRRFYALNLLEELDASGEWYYERKARKLYWLPPADAGGEIVLAQDLTPFIRVDHAQHIRFENLSFAYSHGPSEIVSIRKSDHCVVRNCRFDNISSHAVYVEGRRNRVTGCTMRNMGESAVTVYGGDRRNLLPANNLIDKCTVVNNGMYKRSRSKAFNISDGCGNAIRECRVTEAPDGAVYYGGNEHLIADNEFGNIILEIGDAGATYTGHNASNLGTILFGNYIHHLAKTEAEESSRSAIYFDDCDWGDDAIGNTLVHCGMGFLIGGGKLHGIYNNLVVSCRTGMLLDGRGRGWRTDREHGSFWWAKDGRTFSEYRHDESNVDPDRAPWCVAYPSLREAMDNRPEYPGMNDIAGNVFRNCKTPLVYDDNSARVTDVTLKGNRILANSNESSLVAPQPIRLKDAVVNRLESEDGGTVARVALDVSGHFHWTLSVNGQPVLDQSPLGITVGRLNHWTRVVPGLAEERPRVSLAPFTNATCQVELKGGVAVRTAVTNIAAFAALSAREWRIPIRNLVTAKTDAFLDVRVWNGGAAYRWTVPGTGLRKVVGESNAFIPADGNRCSITPLEWERDDDFANGYPEVLYYPRGPGYGVMHPEFAHGWMHDGPVVSPWRGICK